MCFICVQIQSENIEFSKAKEFLEEIKDLIGETHYEEVKKKIDATTLAPSPHKHPVQLDIDWTWGLDWDWDFYD